MRLNTSIKGKRLNLTYHCVDRYIERVRQLPFPTEDERERYATELCVLIRKHAILIKKEPDWLPRYPYGDDQQHRGNADIWIVVGDDIAFPVTCRGRSNIVLTCITRGGFSEARRATRNRIKAEKRASRRASRAHDSWRGEKNPRWQ